LAGAISGAGDAGCGAVEGCVMSGATGAECGCCLVGPAMAPALARPATRAAVTSALLVMPNRLSDAVLLRSEPPGSHIVASTSVDLDRAHSAAAAAVRH
jgi:hypothetical protein